MMPPLTLFLLVVAPMIAPAAAPMAASRCVFFCTVVRVGAGAGAVLTEPFDAEDVRALDRVVLVRLVLRGAVAAAPRAAFPRSIAEMLSSARAESALFARFRSFCSASFLSL